MEQIETIPHPAAELAEVARWAQAITGLEAKGEILAQRRTDLEREQRGLLAEKAAGNQDGDARLSALRTELAENEQESAEVRLALPEAGRRLVKAQREAKDAAIVVLTDILSALRTQRAALITQARSGDPAALERAYVCHRQAFGLTTDLHTLTKDGQFSEIWNLSPFAPDLLADAERIHNACRLGQVKIPRPWADLLGLSQA
jgi:hypothetical protein